jgi:hypothetical protein
LRSLQEKLGFEQAEAAKLCEELEVFLKAANSASTTQIDRRIAEDINPPEQNIAIHYRFGNLGVQVNYGSGLIKSLFHPQLAHFSSNTSEPVGMILDIFQVGQLLYLFKNETPAYAYDTISYHFIQGAFSLELTNYIHNKTASNWLASFHASTICNDQEAIMLVGESGNGKSTLSALLTAHGMDLLADDFTPMYADDLMLYRYPNAVSIKAGAFDMMAKTVSNFETLETHFKDAKQTNVKYLPSPVDYASAVKALPCKTILYVKYSKDGDSNLKKASAEKILATLIPDSWISPQPEHAKLFLDWLEQVRFYELNYSDNDYAIEAFKTLFDAAAAD